MQSPSAPPDGDTGVRTERIMSTATMEKASLSCSTSECAVQKAVSTVEVELQRGLSAFRLSERSTNENSPEDDAGSIASEMERLPGFEENLRQGLRALEDSWLREKERTGRNFEEIPAVVPLSSEDSLSSSESSSTEDENQLKSRRDSITSSTADDSSALETGLISVLGQSSGLGRMSLALASDMAASRNLGSRHSSILLPWLKSQVERTIPSMNVEWLFRAPLSLGTVASSRDNGLLPVSIPEICNLWQPDEIQEIEEEEEDDHEIDCHLG